MDTQKTDFFTDQLLEAIDVIAEKKVANLSFDKTMLGTVTSVIDAETGIYEVSFNISNSRSSAFTAYATEGMEYSVGDNVYVNIPQNDFSNQKIILNKQVTDQSKPLNYIPPLERFIKIFQLESVFADGIIRNDENNTDYHAFSEYGVSLLANNISKSEILIYNKVFENEKLNHYNCIGVSAEFLTLLGQYKPLQGTYGLRFELTGLQQGWENVEGALDSYFINKQITFTNHEMYGMPYDYSSWYHQEKLIDLSDFDYPIYKIKVVFFQENNFKDQDDNPIPYKIENNELVGSDKTYIFDDNIFIRNLSIIFGFQLDNVSAGDLKLYTSSSIKYAEETDEINNKNLKLRFITTDSDNEMDLKVIDELSDMPDEFWINKSIYLYKYTYGEKDDDIYAGPFWKKVISWNDFGDNRQTQFYDENNQPFKNLTTEITGWPRPQGEDINLFNGIDLTVTDTYEGDFNEQNINNPFELTIPINNQDKKSAFVRYKILIVERNVVENSAYDINGNQTTYYTVPIENQIIYESNTITFENRDEVPNAVTMALIKGLELTCTDGSNGIYRIYGEDNRISAQSNSQKMILNADFKAIEILGLNTGMTHLIWYYPKYNTMLLPPVDEKVKRKNSEEIDEKNSKIWWRNASQIPESLDINLRNSLIEALNNYYILYKELDVSEYGQSDSIHEIQNSITYTIDSFYSSIKNNNIIRCEITRYGRTYEAEMDFFFGHRGTNGTDYAFDISLEREYDKNTKEPVAATVVPFLKVGNYNYIKVKPTLIYGQEEFASENLTGINWHWYEISKSDGANLDIKILDNNFKSLDNTFGSSSVVTSKEIYLQISDSINLRTYCGILQADIQKYGSGDEEITLSAYLPIGVVSENSNISVYDGGTMILYNDYGSDPLYAAGEYKLFNNDGVKFTNLSWGIKASDSKKALDIYYPSMLDNDNGEYFLHPTNMYFSNIAKDVCIVANNNDTIIFVQPLLIMQNSWGNQALNRWDGKLQINEEGNYILSAMMGAGKKDSNNTFSGVLMGEIQGLNSENENTFETGLFGYKTGTQVYGFTDDGKAFIGPSGAGRILFDGTTSEIQGGYYELEEQGYYNTTINLQTGLIDAKKFRLYASEDNSEDPQYFIKLTSNYEKEITEYDEEDNPIYGYQEYPLEIGKKFSVDWDGTVRMSGAIIGNVFEESDEVEQENGISTIEDLMKNMYLNYVNRDILEAIMREQADQDEANRRISGDVNEAAERIAAALEEARIRLDADGSLSFDISKEEQERIAALQPDNLYNSMIETVDIGGKGYFLITNKTYGEETSQTEFLIDDSKNGTLVAKNLIATGIMNAYAGQFGGWNLLPGLMHYGYNTSAIITDRGTHWSGDFFGGMQYRERYDENYNLIDYSEVPRGGWENVPLDELINKPGFNFFDVFNSKDIRYKTDNDEGVQVDSTKAFIYLGDCGRGIKITGFGENTISYSNDNAPSYSLDNEDSEDNFIKYVIMSIGSNFAVDAGGNLFANDGHFSGVINSIEGNIGGWIITDEGIINRVIERENGTYNDGAIYDESGKLEKDVSTIWIIPEGKDISRNMRDLKLSDDEMVQWPKENGEYKIFSDIVLRISDNFYVDTAGKIYAKDGEFTGSINSIEGNIGGWIISDYGIVYNDTIGLFSKAYRSPTQLVNENGESVYDNNGDPIYSENFEEGWYEFERGDTSPVIKITDEFQVNYNGSLLANSATITGTINATSLNIGDVSAETYVTGFVNDGLDSYSDTLFGVDGEPTGIVTFVHNNTEGLNDVIVMINGLITDEGQTISTTDNTSYNESTEGTEFRISSKGLLTAANAIITGNIYATGGWIGGWNIYDNYLGTAKASTANFSITINGENETYESALRGGDTFLTAKSNGLKAPKGLLQSFQIPSKDDTYFLFNVGNQFAITTAGKAYMKEANVSGTINATSLYIGAANTPSDEYVAGFVNDGLDSYSDTLFGVDGEPTGIVTFVHNNTEGLNDVIVMINGLIDENGQDSNTSDISYNESTEGTAFKVSSKGLLTAANAIITGNIYATGGWIGGWNIYDTYLGTAKASKKSFSFVINDEIQTYEFALRGGDTFLTAKSDGLKGPQNLLKNFQIPSNDDPYFLFNVGNQFAITTKGKAYMKAANVSGTIYATSLYIGENNSIKDIDNYVGDYIDSDLDTYSKNLFGSHNLNDNDIVNNHYVPNLITILKRDLKENSSDADTVKFLYGGRSIGTKGNINDNAASGNEQSTPYFEVNKNGLLTARNAIITGTVYASAGYIGNWDIGYDNIGVLRGKTTSGAITLDPTGATKFNWTSYNSTEATEIDNGMIVLTHDTSSNVIGMTKNGKFYASSAYLKGTIEANSGSIAGWTINKNTIVSQTANTRLVLDSRGKIALTSEKTIEDENGNPSYTVSSGFDLNTTSGTLTLQNIELKMANILSGTIRRNAILEGSGYKYDAEGELITDENGDPIPVDESNTIGTIASNGTNAIKKNDSLYDENNLYSFKVSGAGKLTCTGAVISGNQGTGNLITGQNESGTVTFSVTQDGKLTCKGADIDGTMTAGSIKAGVSIETPMISSGLYLPYRSNSEGDLTSSSSYTGLILNLTGSGRYGGWRDSLFTVGGNTVSGAPFYAFIRGAGSQSNARTNAFLGVQNQSTSYNIGASGAGPTFDSAKPTGNYVAYIRFDGAAYFSSLNLPYKTSYTDVGTKLSDLSDDVTNLQNLLASLTSRVETLESKV